MGKLFSILGGKKEGVSRGEGKRLISMDSLSLWLELGFGWLVGWLVS